MAGPKVRVNSPKLRYMEDFIEAEYEYQTTNVTEVDGGGNNDDDSASYTVSVNRYVRSVPTLVARYDSPSEKIFTANQETI